MWNKIDIEKLRRGDSKTFQLFFEYFYPKLMALACRFVNEYAAKDIVQELFAFYWENRKTIEAENLQSYLYKSLQNACLNYLKHRMVVTEYETRVRIAEERMDYWFERLDSDDLMKRIISQNIREVIEASANKLPPKCRQAFFLCYFHDMSHKQIAEVMDISIRTVETHIRQAVSFLRVDLRDLFYYIGFFFVFTT